MTVLVTGGTGFLGSHLVARLRRDGTDPIVPTRASHDLTVAGEVARLFAETRPRVVFHLAAEVGGIGANQESPGRFWYANLLMGAHVLEESRRHAVDKLVVVGTVCAYPGIVPVPFREDDLWNGYPEPTNAPYGIAKRALLVGAQAYRSQYGLDAIFLLPANLYGPSDDVDPRSSHVIPALIRKMVDARRQGLDRVVLWGDGSATREFLYVEDCAEALVLASQRYSGSDPVNLGTGQEISIAELARLIAAETSFTGEIAWDESRPNGQIRRALDTTRARELFGFRASTPLAAGIRRTVEWYETVASPGSADRLGSRSAA